MALILEKTVRQEKGILFFCVTFNKTFHLKTSGLVRNVLYALWERGKMPTSANSQDNLRTEEKVRKQGTRVALYSVIS